MKELLDIQFQELKTVIKPYKKDWNEWTQSPDCFLEEEEVIAVNKFLNIRGFTGAKDETESTEVMQYIRLKNAITKLTLFQDIFKKYKKIRREMQKNKIKYKKTGRSSRS